MSKNRERLLSAVSAGLLAGGGWASYFAFSRPGQDFLSYRLMAEGILRGINVYDPVARATLSRALGSEPPAGMYYPPATGVMMSPFALPPYDVAKALWFCVMVAAVVVGVRGLVRAAVPGAPTRVWMATAGLVLMSSSVRWGLMLLQGAPLVIGLLCFFLVSLLKKDSPWPVVIAVVATAFKLTLGLPFLGLLLLHRRYFGIALAILFPVVLNVLGFARMGDGALANYRHDVATLDALTSDNMNSPDPWLPYSLPRLDWIYLFYGITRNLVVARFLTLAASAGVGLWLLREMLRTRSPSGLEVNAVFCAPLICLGSVVVYHHQYDISPLIAPALVGYFGWQRLAQPRWAVVLVLPLLVMMAILPIGLIQSLIRPAFGSTGVVMLKLSFSIAVTLALAGAVAILRRYRAFDAQRGATPVVAVTPPV